MKQTTKTTFSPLYEHEGVIKYYHHIVSNGSSVNLTKEERLKQKLDAYLYAYRFVILEYPKFRTWCMRKSDEYWDDVVNNSERTATKLMVVLRAVVREWQTNISYMDVAVEHSLSEKDKNTLSQYILHLHPESRLRTIRDLLTNKKLLNQILDTELEDMEDDLIDDNKDKVAKGNEVDSDSEDEIYDTDYTFVSASSWQRFIDLEDECSIDKLELFSHIASNLRDAPKEVVKSQYKKLGIPTGLSKEKLAMTAYEVMMKYYLNLSGAERSEFLDRLISKVQPLFTFDDD